MLTIIGNSFILRAVEQFNGREGETATLYERRSLNPKLRGGGFAPRHLSRWTTSLDIRGANYES